MALLMLVGAMMLAQGGNDAGPKPGDLRVLAMPDSGGLIPVLSGEGAYRRFSSALRSRSLRDLKALLNRGDMRLFEPAVRVKVAALHMERPPRPSLYIPAAEVQSADGKPLAANLGREARLWIPLAYLRDDGERPEKEEASLPTFAFTGKPYEITEPGMEVLLMLADGDVVPVVSDVAGLDLLAKSFDASDRAGLREQYEAGGVSLVPAMTHALVVERFKNRFVAKNKASMQVRIKEGELKDKLVWTFEIYACTPELKVTMPDYGGEPAKRKAGRKR